MPKRFGIGLILGIVISLVGVGIAAAAMALVSNDTPSAAQPVELELVGSLPFTSPNAVASSEIDGTPYAFLGVGGCWCWTSPTRLIPASPRL